MATTLLMVPMGDPKVFKSEPKIAAYTGLVPSKAERVKKRRSRATLG